MNWWIKALLSAKRRTVRSRRDDRTYRFVVALASTQRHCIYKSVAASRPVLSETRALLRITVSVYREQPLCDYSKPGWALFHSIKKNWRTLKRNREISNGLAIARIARECLWSLKRQKLSIKSSSVLPEKKPFLRFIMSDIERDVQNSYSVLHARLIKASSARWRNLFSRSLRGLQLCDTNNHSGRLFVLQQVGFTWKKINCNGLQTFQPVCANFWQSTRWFGCFEK